MPRNGFLSIGVLLCSCLLARAEDPAVLKAENESLRRERDTLEARLRIIQDQLDDARKTASLARLEVDSLEFRCKKLQDELKLIKNEQAPVRVLQEEKPATPVAKPAIAHGKITAIASDGRMMQVSVGATAGLRKGQALEVFRVSTDKGRLAPVYFGTLELIRVDTNAALGHFKSVPGLDRSPKIGDDAASELVIK